jgi:hypothetical protein
MEYKVRGGDYVKMKFSEEYFEFGVPVEIEPPPAKQVLDVTECFCPQRGDGDERRLTT